MRTRHDDAICFDGLVLDGWMPLGSATRRRLERALMALLALVIIP